MDPALRAESKHYDDEYGSATLEGPSDLESLGSAWIGNPYAPFNERLLEAIGEVRDAVVVVLGNGVSLKELFLLTRDPKALVCSDLSENAVRAVMGHQPDLRGRPNAFFAAIDGGELPFADASVDVVYGYAFVHHLRDLDHFVGEVARVLRPGGRGVFMDAAYSPLWQAAKSGPLRQLKRLGHRVNPISAEDARATLEGGFRKDDLARLAESVGCTLWYEPTGLVHYLATRTGQVFGNRWPALELQPRWVPDRGRRHRFAIRQGRVLQTLDVLDQKLGRLRLARENRMRLLWGISRPPPPTTLDHKAREPALAKPLD
jgi:SAM-dependent methyltransferase